MNCGSYYGRAKYIQIATMPYNFTTAFIMENFKSFLLKRLLISIVCLLSVQTANSLELLSEGAMGSVSAVTANSAEEIISIAGSTAAGLRVDDEYETLPFQTEVKVDEYATDEVSEDLNYALTQEVDAWTQTLKQRTEDPVNLEVGYIDELPESSFDEANFVVRDQEFDRLIFEPPVEEDSEQQGTIYELGRVEQALTKLEQNVDSVRYIIRREVDFVATIDASISDDTPSIGSGYISNLTSISNVKIASVRD